MFKKVLIANRGEITVRIAHTLQTMGIRTVAVYSNPDSAANHVASADEAYLLEGDSSADTYLRADKIIALARQHNVDAIHPGYGFLSENAAFAENCAKAGITFIGPTPEVIRQMGDKIIAKKTMQDAGVPVLPGWSGSANTSETELQREADKIGYPLLVKAAAGGGGKGMRLVDRSEDLPAALAAAAREAGNAFGDSRIFLEKYITRCRHVEFQIFGDAHGNAVHLFERECSIQRRHQKIIEETPCPILSDDLRNKMGSSAVKAAKALGYQNAGTVEFILADDGSYYFLEVNTRLQVEHPITEETVHADLVRAQILVASGEKLPFTQETLRQSGHAIECRIYAEDPTNNYMPSTGRIGCYVPPTGPGIRVDSGVSTGSEVSVHYDPMLAKLICTGQNRDAALRRMRWALSRFVILGVTHNIAFLRRVIEHPEFTSGATHTQFLTEHEISSNTAIPEDAYIAAAAGKMLASGKLLVSGKRLASGGISNATQSDTRDGSTRGTSDQSPWGVSGGWRTLAS